MSEFGTQRIAGAETIHAHNASCLPMSARKNTVVPVVGVKLVAQSAEDGARELPRWGIAFFNEWRGYSAELGNSALARLARIFLPRRRVLRNPLGRVVFCDKALDDFRFAIRPQNIDRPSGAGIFASHESWSLLDYGVTMRRRWPATSQ
jgi:hypothetical protein